MFIITGCGRSGTNYIATRLRENGINCGHESVFQVSGPTINNGGYDGDSSWFAALFLGDSFVEAPVLHVVRSPRKVIESFHKIGLCSASKCRHLTQGHGVLRFCVRNKFSLSKILDRLRYVDDHRRLLKEHTSVWDFDGEFYRLCEYWYQWNMLIEDVMPKNKPYLRVRLDDVDIRWLEICEFLGVKGEVTAARNPTNLKSGYRKIEPFNLELPDHVKKIIRKV